MKYKISYKYVIIKYSLIIISVILFGIAGLIWYTYLHTEQTPLLTFNLCLTIGMGFFSIFVAVISIKIAEESKQQAEDTDERINNIANTHFITIVSSFEDRRLDIQKFPDTHQIFLWKAVVDLDKANEISSGKCKIKSKHFKTLMNRFLTLMESVHYVKFMFKCESVNNIISIYKKVFKIVPDNILSKPYEDGGITNRDKAKWYFRQLLDLKDNIPVNEQLFTIIKKTTHEEKNRWKEYDKFEKKLIREIEKDLINN